MTTADGLSPLLKAFTEELRRELGPNLLLLTLYGSHARGEAEPDSDVDILVVLRRSSEALYEKVREVAYKVMWEADFAYVFSLYLTDVHHYKTLEQHGSSFLRNIQQGAPVTASTGRAPRSDQPAGCFPAYWKGFTSTRCGIGNLQGRP